MNLTRFLDCAVTLLYEEFQRVGKDVFEAFDEVREWAARTLAPDDAPQPKRETKVDPARNDRSMTEFMGLMAGAGGMPG